MITAISIWRVYKYKVVILSQKSKCRVTGLSPCNAVTLQILVKGIQMEFGNFEKTVNTSKN